MTALEIRRFKTRRNQRSAKNGRVLYRHGRVGSDLIARVLAPLRFRR
jgi:hypothetical protein